MIRELGLDSEIVASNDHQRSTYIRKRGRMVRMPDGLMMVVPTKIMPMALSGLLGWGTKARMALEYFRRPGAPHPDRSIAEFIRDHYGQEAVDYLAEPLLSGVYGGDPRDLSVSTACCPASPSWRSVTAASPGECWRTAPNKAAPRCSKRSGAA